MKLIKQEKINTQVSDQQMWNFDVSENGVYIILVSARCKNWLQNYKRLFNDDDLAIQIDDHLFAEIKGKKREFASPGSWNGNEIKGDTKNVLFVLPIKAGAHQIKFWVDGYPLLEEISLYKIDESGIDLITSKVVTPGNFFDIISKNLKVEKLEVKAKAEIDSNLEIKIDGKTEKNPKYKRFEKWYWYGQELMGNTKEYNMQNIWDGDQHYVQVSGQGKPEIQSIKLEVSLKNIVYSSGFVKLYKDIVPNDLVNLRVEPTDESESLMKFSSGEKVELINDKIAGKYITNDSNIWHEIIVRGIKGYILSSFVEIGGQERDVIIFKVKDQAKIRGIDPDFAVALAGCESHYKPYAVSSSGALGIFQLTSIMRIDLEQRFNLKISDHECFEVDKNIIAGITYLKWLFGVYKGTKDEYKKITAAWNAGKSLIPVNGPINYEHIKDIKKREEAKNLVNCVEQNRKSKDWHNLFFSVLIIITFLFGVRVLLPIFPSENINLEAQVVKAPTFFEGNDNINNTKFIFEYPDFDSNLKSVIVTTFSSEKFDWTTKVEVVFHDITYFKEYSGALYNAYISDSLGFGFPKLVIIRGEGQQILTSILELDGQGKNVNPIDFIEKDGTKSDDLCCSYMIPIPMDNGVQYDIGMPVFATNPIKVKVYRHNTEKHAFIEERFEYLK